MEDDLAVSGIHAMLFDDDSTAAFVASDEALVPWSGDDRVLMDRYDVRHLIDASALHRRASCAPGDEISEEELDYERYRDLHETEDFRVSVDGVEKNASSFAYTSVSFDYGGCKKVEETKDKAKEERSEIENEKLSSPPTSEKGKVEQPFVPAFPVPENLQAHLPNSQKEHQIISGTAKFVSERGGQAEVILKVKQADNPKFGFLLPDHILHPYFRYLIDHPELTGASSTSSSTPPPPLPPQVGTASITRPAEGLRLLGEVYGEDDDDDDDDGPVQGAATLPLTVEIRKIKEPPQDLKNIIDKMVKFIARNGKEFEDVVRDRDESDERFHFLRPWHEYHPYYLRMLQNVDQTAKRRSSLGRHRQPSKQPAFSKPSSGSPFHASRDLDGRQHRSGQRRNTRFDVPPSALQKEEAQTVIQDEQVYSEKEYVKDIVSGGGIDESQQQSGMSYDATLAAVLAATRGIQKPKQENAKRKEERAEVKSDIKAERLKRAKLLVENGYEESISTRPATFKARKREESIKEYRQINREETEKRKHHSSSSNGTERQKLEEVSDDFRSKVRAMLQQL